MQTPTSSKFSIQREIAENHRYTQFRKYLTLLLCFVSNFNFKTCPYFNFSPSSLPLTILNVFSNFPHKTQKLQRLAHLDGCKVQPSFTTSPKNQSMGGQPAVSNVTEGYTVIVLILSPFSLLAFIRESSVRTQPPGVTSFRRPPPHLDLPSEACHRSVIMQGRPKIANHSLEDSSSMEPPLSIIFFSIKYGLVSSNRNEN